MKDERFSLVQVTIPQLLHFGSMDEPERELLNYVIQESIDLSDNARINLQNVRLVIEGFLMPDRVLLGLHGAFLEKKESEEKEESGLLSRFFSGNKK